MDQFGMFSSRDDSVFSNEVRRDALRRFFARYSDDDIARMPSETLVELAYDKLKIDQPRLSKEPKIEIRAGQLGAVDTVDFHHIIEGDVRPYRIRYNQIQPPFPRHVLNDKTVTFSYPATNVEDVRKQHAADLEILLGHTAKADEAVQSFNGMLKAEINAMVIDLKTAAERRRKFLEDLQS